MTHPMMAVNHRGGWALTNDLEFGFGKLDPLLDAVVINRFEPTNTMRVDPALVGGDQDIGADSGLFGWHPSWRRNFILIGVAGLIPLLLGLVALPQPRIDLALPIERREGVDLNPPPRNPPRAKAPGTGSRARAAARAAAMSLVRAGFMAIRLAELGADEGGEEDRHRDEAEA